MICKQKKQQQKKLIFLQTIYRVFSFYAQEHFCLFPDIERNTVYKYLP